MAEETRVVLAIDPGRMKCGVAVVQSEAGKFSALYQQVIDSRSLADTLSRLAASYSPEAIVIGDGTGSASAVAQIEALGIGPVVVVDEKSTTLFARRRFFENNPPRGLRRLIPVSMQTPPRPYDDYVAIILAERHLSAGK